MQRLGKILEERGRSLLLTGGGAPAQSQEHSVVGGDSGGQWVPQMGVESLSEVQDRLQPLAQGLPV